MHLNAGAFDPEKAKSYDVVIKCIGSKQNSGYMRDNLSRCIDSAGRIKVNEYFQITENDPSSYIISNPVY